ncbi:MAG: glycosyltransferase family 4 protein [Prevotella sp.]|nr:glycosyltransferase family 4 protein [Prevotella sp.]
MTIGFDAKRIVSNRTGLGSYGRNLINDLAAINSTDRILLFAPDSGHADLREQVVMRGNVRLICPENLHFRFQRDLWRTHGIVRSLRENGVHIFHGLSGELPHGLKAAGIRGIVTIHDLIFLRHPEYYNWIDVQIYKRKFHQTLREADRIIAISECTKRDILHYGNFPEDRIDVIYQSCDTRFKQRSDELTKQRVRQQYSLPNRYILNVGTVEERKNVLLAIRALRNLPDELHLVVVGRQTKYQRTLQKELNDGLSSRVHFLQGVPNADLYAIYQQAQCFVYPSRYEGFGIPIIEAIQSGLPVVAATGSCLEEAGGPDCLYVDPDDPEAMSEAISSLLTGSNESTARSKEYVRRFENNSVAQQIQHIYQQIIL